MMMTEGKETSLNASLRNADDLEDAHPTKLVVHSPTDSGALNLSNIGALNISDKELDVGN